VTLLTLPLDELAALLDELPPIAPHEGGITLAYKLWDEMSLVKDAEENERH
jgi:hypothetical protein